MEEKLIKTLEDYNKSTLEITDGVYNLIDKKIYKIDLCNIFTKHKEILKRLEKILKIY